MANGAYLRLDVARHSDVDGHQGLRISLHHQISHIPSLYDVLGRAGGGDDDVYIVSVIQSTGKRHSPAADFLRQFFCLVHMAVRDDHFFEALALEVLHQKLSGFPGTENHSRAIFQAA